MSKGGHLGPLTRRGFLSTSSLALAGIATRGMGQTAPSTRLVPTRSRRPVTDFAPPLLDAEALRTFATAAMEAAVAAGAEYADIRVSDSRFFVPTGDPSVASRLTLACGFGLRVQVGGATTFVSGADFTRDSLARTAQEATHSARLLAAVAKQPRLALSAPVVRGEWSVPVEIDPFTVSPEDHCALLGGFQQPHGHGRGGDILDAEAEWTVETRVFAASTGSLLTQHLTRCNPKFGTRSKSWRTDWIGYGIPVRVPYSAGVEYLLAPKLHEQLHAAVAEVEELVRIPLGKTDVGRKEIVMDGYAHGAAVGKVLLPALSLSRVLGEEQNHAGTSIWSPIETALGHPVGVPGFNLRVASELPSFGATRWDDDGVATTPATIIDDGVLVDYFGTRFNRAALPQALQQLRGTTTTPDVQRPPTGMPTAVVVNAAASGPTLTDLVSQINDGFLLRGVRWVETDPQGNGGVISPDVLLEIKRGKILRRIMNATVEFPARKLWTGLTTMGSSSTLCPAVCIAQLEPPPWKRVLTVVTAPAAHFRSVDIVHKV